MDAIVLNCGMNDKQKWFIVVSVGCISALVMAIMFGRVVAVFDVEIWISEGGIASNWTGCVLFGMLCSSITGFFLFKDK